MDGGVGGVCNGTHVIWESMGRDGTEVARVVVAVSGVCYGPPVRWARARAMIA